MPCLLRNNEVAPRQLEWPCMTLQRWLGPFSLKGETKQNKKYLLPITSFSFSPFLLQKTSKEQSTLASYNSSFSLPLEPCAARILFKTPVTAIALGLMITSVFGQHWEHHGSFLIHTCVSLTSMKPSLGPYSTSLVPSQPPLLAVPHFPHPLSVVFLFSLEPFLSLVF